MKMLGGVAVVLLALVLGGCRLLEPPFQPQAPTVRRAGTAHRIPEAFPLLAGLPPARGGVSTRGPSRVLAPLEPRACGRIVRVPPHVDLLRASWHGPDANRERQIVTFATEVDAVAYAEALRDLSRGCSQRRVHVAWVGRHVLLTTPHESRRALAQVVVGLGTLDNTADRPWFGPEGYGAVRLGMSRAELLALPHSRVHWRGRCATFTVDTTDAGRERGVSGILEAHRGITSLVLAAPTSTPEGVGHGTSYDEVRAAYPRAEGDRDLLAVDVPGRSDRYYRFELGPDGVASLILVLHDQHCAG